MTNLGDLDVFSRVIALGSMSQAAREMGLSPAVVSKRIKRLEESLGTRLLQRTTRQICLTEAGQGYYERVIAVLAGLEEAKAFTAGRASHVTGSLKISAPPPLAACILPPISKPSCGRTRKCRCI
jgi:DNA-binding transcriptional LysR family regulator